MGKAMMCPNTTCLYGVALILVSTLLHIVANCLLTFIILLFKNIHTFKFSLLLTASAFQS